MISALHVGSATSSSASVTWITDQPATSAVEFGPLSSYGEWTAEDPALTTSHLVTVNDLSHASMYHFRAISRNIGGQVGRSVDATFGTTSLSNAVRVSAVGPNRTITLDGHPFLPILQWLQCPDLFDLNISLGINTFMGKGCDNTDQDELDQLRSRNALSILPFNAAVKTHPALFGWRFSDEPDMNGIRPPAIRAEYDSIRAQDTNHATFLTVTGGFFSQLSPPAWMNGDRSYYNQYAAATDVMGFDLYPIYGYCRPDWIWWVPDAEHELSTLYAQNNPTYTWIEAASTSSQWCSGRGIYDYELRAEVWMAIANGAKGIGYFTHSWTPDYSQFRVSPEVQAEMARTDRQLKGLALAVLSPSFAVTKHELTTGRVDAIARVRNGAHYIFAVNVSRQQVRVEFRAPELGGRSVTVFEEGRSIAADSTGFVDTFDPLAVHIYVVPPNGL